MINVTKTYLPNREVLDKHISDIYESGWLTNNGQKLQLLTKRLEEFLDVENLLLVSNGTLALQIAYKVFELKGEVLTTPFSFTATTSSLVWENLTPVFVDIDSSSYNIDVNKIEEKITENTSAILPVHVFGNSCDVSHLEEIARKYNLKLIFDAAHSFNVKGEEGNVLKYGDASILSFHATKIFHTIEGGAIIFKNREDLEKAKLLINFGISWYDKIDMLGINAKLNEIQASMGLAVLDEIENIFNTRKVVYDMYLNEFINTKGIQLQFRNKVFSNNYSYFPVVFDSEEILLRIQNTLKFNNIFARRYFYPSLNTLNFVNYQECPNSEDLSKRILCLPLFSSLNYQDQMNIINLVKSNL